MCIKMYIKYIYILSTEYCQQKIWNMFYVSSLFYFAILLTNYLQLALFFTFRKDSFLGLVQPLELLVAAI